MNCRSVQSRLSAYLDGELTGQEMFCMRDHLNRCAECREEAASLKGLKRMIGSIECPEPSKDFESRLAASIGAGHPSRPFFPVKSAILFVGVAGLTMAATFEVLGALSPNPALVSSKRATQSRAGIGFELNRDAMTSSISDPISGTSVWPVADSR